MVAYTCYPIYWVNRVRKIASSRSDQEKLVRPYFKNKTRSRGGGIRVGGRIFLARARPWVKSPVPRRRCICI
jgi:hypothetical protein